MINERGGIKAELQNAAATPRFLFVTVMAGLVPPSTSSLARRTRQM
jgi:hypothetical protein